MFTVVDFSVIFVTPRSPARPLRSARTMLRWPSARGRFSEEIRPMDDVMIAAHIENTDRRLDKIEQILPTLATKEELRLAVAPLATREELRLAIAEAIAPLATKAELQDFRRHMDVLLEALRADIQLLAEHVATVMRRPRK
jgi:hypothetical protein